MTLVVSSGLEAFSTPSLEDQTPKSHGLLAASLSAARADSRVSSLVGEGVAAGTAGRLARREGGRLGALIAGAMSVQIRSATIRAPSSLVWPPSM